MFTRTLVDLDEAALRIVALPGHRPGLVRGAQAVSHLGDHALVWFALALARAARARDARQAAHGACTVAAAHGAAVVLKRLARRQRPPALEHVRSVSTPSLHSFPSSHASSSAAGALLLGGTMAPALALAIGWSRLALGVHYPSDILVGAAVGGAVARAASRLRL